MTSTKELLARAALLKNPRIPEDTVPYRDPYPDVPPALSAAAFPDGEVADDIAADQLRALCEVAATYAATPRFTDFITAELPAPGGAWFLGCLLHLAGSEDGSRYWWQYAAGAGHRGASYCLSLHHRALGDEHTADFYLAQAEDSTHDEGPEASTATVLRIIMQINDATERPLSEAIRAVMAYTVAAVDAGYRLHPDVEIPVPGPHFAETVRLLLALAGPAQSPPGPALEGLPARSDIRRPSPPEPESVLVRLAAPDAEWASAFHAAVAPAWRQIHPEPPQQPGHRGVLMQFVLDRRRSLATARENRARRPRAPRSAPIGIEYGCP